MNEWAIVYVGACVFGWALIERRVGSLPITGPMVFVALGLIASSDGFGIIEVSAGQLPTDIDIVLEGTLALVLFSGAAELQLRRNAVLTVRLLGVGLPLTIAVTWLIAVLLFDDFGIWEAAIVGAIVAPTDAALGKAVISNPRVPRRIRVGLDVESGLNDGISLPFVLIFITLAEGNLSEGDIVTTFVVAIGVAVLVGLGVALVGGWLQIRAERAGWMGGSWSRIAVVALALVAFAVSDQLGGSGFIACFVAGLTYGEVTRDRITAGNAFISDLSNVLTQVSFLLLGAAVIAPVLGEATWQVWLMAVLAITIARIGPVALALIGTGARTPTVAYLGWFGPRGLATIVFAVLVVTDGEISETGLIVTIAAITVALSVYAHGLTAGVGANRYADWFEEQGQPTDFAAG